MPPSAPRNRHRTRFATGLAATALLASVAAATSLALVLTASSPPSLAPLRTIVTKHGGAFVAGTTPVKMRGFDYLPLHLRKVIGKARYYTNETFQPSFYNRAQIAGLIKTWQELKYNSVRVFLNPNQIGNPLGIGLDGSYVANLANFLATASSDGIRTLVTVGVLPTNGGYTPKPNKDFGQANEDYLNPAFISAENRYLRDLITDLQRDRAPLGDALWELMDEQDWYNKAAPLDWKKGTVETADGRTYNMASAASRVAMEDDNLIHWTNSLTATIHRPLPGSLVGVGVYPPSVKRAAWTVRPEVLFSSATKNNFVDIHVYSNLGPELTQITSFSAGNTDKPVIMGEFGATRVTSIAKAAKSLISWQRSSCKIGGGAISGWLLWTWNSAVDLEFYDAQMDDGLIEHALSPTARPNPCA